VTRAYLGSHVPAWCVAVAVAASPGYCFNVCCGGSDKKFYNSADDAEDPKYHLEKMRKQFPVLTIYIRCFHHETRTRTVTSTDSCVVWWFEC